ncbi:methyltransferase domain-containing protein [Nitrosopumilus adriaticus]|uniref:methyltransferase domain-containing protein n=1 Tax=Nitrosopumilus adriaticus TaxID=1580092 RepID=UPI00352C3067
MKCRFCHTSKFSNFLDLGRTPLSNSFLKKSQIKKKEKTFPLHAYVCHNCLLVQLKEFENPENIFSNYAYFSSFSKSWLEHSKKFVEKSIKKFNLNDKSQIIEIASNDGYLLQYFKKRKIPVLGIEPAKNVSKIARKQGIPTITKFFGKKTAKQLTDKGIRADLIIANNVLAHVPNLNDFIMGLKILLDENGVISLEFPHILKLIQKNQFDTIYHEHFSYFSFLTIKKIFLKHKLDIFDVNEIPTHGGSLRIYVKHKENEKISINNSVENLIQKEIKNSINKIKTYKEFEPKIKKIREDIQKFFLIAKKENKKVIGYGAPAKGNTLLNYCNIKEKDLKFTVDISPHKKELYLPGTHIQIKDIKEIKKEKPDYLFILPWNLKEEIIHEQNYIKKWGGKFVIPIPKVKIIR